jgi:hypothetical protein
VVFAAQNRAAAGEANARLGEARSNYEGIVAAYGAAR